MDIFVCIKRVPDVSETEVTIAPNGTSIVDADLDFGLNEWDAFAVEEAIRLREQHGGKVTAVTIGPEESEDELRRALAMGADEAVRIDVPEPAVLDALGAARLLHAFFGGKTFDLILTGAVASDTGSGQVGGMLAGLLDVPQVALATDVDIADGSVTVQHEVEGGVERVVEFSLPAVVSVQTGLNEPRYVSIRGIRRVSGAEIGVIRPEELGAPPPPARVRTVELMIPPRGKAGELLEGDPEEVVDQLIVLLREKGGLQR